MTVRENMGFSLRSLGTQKEVIDDKVGQAAQILKLEDFLDRRPKDLSGGQRQRVAIGRSIVGAHCFFDEPLSNLDASRVEMRLELHGTSDEDYYGLCNLTKSRPRLLQTE